MALTKILRHRAPLDGSWFRTTANLNSILRAQSLYDDDMTWPKFVDDTTVPVWLSMRKYKAQETRENPDGMIYGPVMRLGTFDSPEVTMFGHHFAVGLFHDYRLDGSIGERKWIYRPFDDDFPPPGEEVSVYRCDKCNHDLYRDDRGRRYDLSACIFDGGLVCRDCDVTGLVYDEETETQLERALRLAEYVGGDCRTSLDRRIDQLRCGFSFGGKSQTRLFREDKFSFNWSTILFTDEGKKRGLHGGLIQHGPCPIEDGDTFKFRTWDYGLKCERDATKAEIEGIHWGIHT